MTVAGVRRRIGLAELRLDRLDEARSWVNEAPLKLVAAALSDIRGMAKAGAVKERLEGLVLDAGEKWKPWWDQVRHAVSDSKYFRTDRNKKGTITAIGLKPGYYADYLPAEPLPPKPAKAPKKKAATLTDWKRWLLSEAGIPPPGRFPTKNVSGALAKWPPKTIGQALRGAIQGAEEYLESGGASARDAAGWLEAVSRATLRWRECVGLESGDGLAERTGNLTTRLAQVAGYEKGAGDWLLLAGALSGQPDDWRREFAAGMWAAFQDSGDGARDLLMASSAQPGHKDQAYLALEIALAAFGANGSVPGHSQLDRLLSIVPARERVQVIQNLILRSSAGDAPGNKVLDYLANSRHTAKLTAPTERLDLLVMAAMLLTDGQGQVANQASHEIGEALNGLSENGNVPVWSGLLSDVRQRISNERESLIAELESQRLSHEVKLGKMRTEEERLRRQVEGLRGQIAAGREESRFDIRQDMLLVIGETLQSFRQRKGSPEELLRHIEARLALALRAGRAEEFGTVGESVPFDPILHQGENGSHIHIGASVRVSAPGSIVRGKSTGGRVLFKAKVEHPSEVI